MAPRDPMSSRRRDRLLEFLAAQEDRKVGIVPFIAVTVAMGMAMVAGLVVLQSTISRISTRSSDRDIQVCELANLATALRPLFVPVPSVTQLIDDFVDDVRTNDPQCLVTTYPAPPRPTATVTMPGKTKTVRKIVRRQVPVYVTVTPKPTPSAPQGPPRQRPPRRHHKPSSSPTPSRLCLYTIPVTGTPVCLPRTH